MACELKKAAQWPILDIAPFLSERKEPAPMTKRTKQTKAEPNLDPQTQARTPREGTEQAALIAMLSAPEGATIAESATALGWEHHTVLSVLSRALKTHLEHTIKSRLHKNRGRIYWIGIIPLTHQPLYVDFPAQAGDAVGAAAPI